jgi:N-methylhydantoinase A
MGLLDPGAFNAGQMSLDPAPALAAFGELDTPLSLEQRISYAYRIGLNNVAEGLIDVTIGRGLDPRDYSLLAFGAAGPLMLPAILDHVKARRVIVPPYPGLFSALGLVSSDQVFTASRSAYLVLSAEAAPRIGALYEEMERALQTYVPDGTDVEIRRTFDGRLVGQSWDTPFVVVSGGAFGADTVEMMITAFHDEYESRYGNRFEAVPVEAVTYRVQLILSAQKVDYPRVAQGPGGVVEPERTITLSYLGADEQRAGEHQREALQAGDVVRGPAVIREPMSTTHVCAGQVGTVGVYGEIVIEEGRL